MSTATCFLKPALRRANLDVRTHAQATRLLFEDGKAAGVACHPAHPARPRAFSHAAKSSCPAAPSIRPSCFSCLAWGRLDCCASMASTSSATCGVGENLSDHYSVRVVARVKHADHEPAGQGLRLAGQIGRWLMKRPSIMALSPSLLHYFWKSMPDLAAPDLQGVFARQLKEGYVGMLDDFPGMTTGIWQHRPDSRGQVRICSADPLRDPLILANYLEDERDQQTLVRGIRLARQLLRSQALAPYFDGEVLPGPLCESDAELLDFARRYGVSSYHVNGTARMGQADDRYAVVDPQLRVHGIGKLRIVDSSVMPSMPSANICAASMMIGNKAADLIKRS